MFVGKGSPPDLQSMRMVLLLIATGTAIFWRTVIKLIVIMAILLALVGALTLSQNFH